MIDEIRRRARANHARIALGVRNPTPEVIGSAEAAGEYAEVVLVGPAGQIESLGTTLEVVDGDPESLLVEMLMCGEVEGVVRGNARANTTLSGLKRALGTSKMYRAALLSTASGKLFFLVPVGIDEGASSDDRVVLASLAADYLRGLGMEPHVGVLGGGRADDRGRSHIVDLSLDEADYIVRLLREQGVDAHNYTILIEDAIERSHVVVAPEGISGNLIFRTLVFLGDGRALGAPLLGAGVVYVDTSRVRGDYTDAIMLASSLVQR